MPLLYLKALVSLFALKLGLGAPYTSRHSLVCSFLICPQTWPSLVLLILSRHSLICSFLICPQTWPSLVLLILSRHSLVCSLLICPQSWPWFPLYFKAFFSIYVPYLPSNLALVPLILQGILQYVLSLFALNLGLDASNTSRHSLVCSFLICPQSWP